MSGEPNLRGAECSGAKFLEELNLRRAECLGSQMSVEPNLRGAESQRVKCRRVKMFLDKISKYLKPKCATGQTTMGATSFASQRSGRKISQTGSHRGQMSKGPNAQKAQCPRGPMSKGPNVSVPIYKGSKMSRFSYNYIQRELNAPCLGAGGRLHGGSRGLIGLLCMYI